MERSILWEHDGSYSNYRIPGITVTDKGTVITYCEARRTSDDWALMDILAKRSEDGGKSFSEPFMLAAGTDETPTVNNPVMVQDRNGRIHFLYCGTYSAGERRADVEREDRHNGFRASGLQKRVRARTGTRDMPL